MRARLFAVVISAAAFCAACSSGPSSPLTPAGAAGSTAAHAGHERYDATGIWFGLIYLGEQRIGEGYHRFTQDARGNLVAVGTEDPDDPEFDPGTYTFKRINGRFAPVGKYRLTIFAPPGEGDSCPRDLSGKATLDSTANTIEAEVTGTIDDCAVLTLRFVWRKQ